MVSDNLCSLALKTPVTETGNQNLNDLSTYYTGHKIRKKRSEKKYEEDLMDIRLSWSPYETLNSKLAI